MKKQIERIKSIKTPLRITYTVYKGDNRNCDVGNICSVHQKFFEDALVELGRIDDDSYKFIHQSIFKWGGIDKVNPSVVIEVEEL